MTKPRESLNTVETSFSKLPYAPESNGKCPHCGCTVYFAEPTSIELTGYQFVKDSPVFLITESGEDRVSVLSSECPNCKKPIVVAEIKRNGQTIVRLVHPYNIVRLVPPEVPKEIATDFLESASVLSASEKASAALSRRCLQNLLNDRNYKGGDLNTQIDLALKDLPSRIAENLDAIRVLGNFAAHPMKFQSSGIIVDVEPEEASWNLDVLEQLFDHYYVQPKIAEQKRNALNAKLQGLGKQPLKKP